MVKTDSIWPNGVAIDVLGVTGAFASGKTLFVCSIDPARTRLYDYEKSAGAYSGLGIDRVDVPSVMLAKYPKAYSTRQLFEWWYNDIKSIEPGRYSVIAGDPISDIEDGLVDWVKARHKEWGFKTEEAFVSTGGIFWSKVRSEWKRVLADLSSRCQTFAFTTHLKLVWKYGKPTTQQTPKGKTTLMELASLFLFLERDSDVLVPSATVLKSRLAVTSVKDGEIQVVPALPPRLKVATPKQIREYIVNPPNYAQLTEEEREQDKPLSEADRLEMEAQIAADKRAAEELALQTAQTQAKIQTAREIAMSRLRPVVAPAPEAKVEEAPAPEEGSGTSEEVPSDQTEPAKDEQQAPVDLIDSIKASGKLVECARLVYKKLKARGEDVSKLRPETLGNYLNLLSEDEQAKLKTWLSS